MTPMARRRSLISLLRTWLYTLARFLGGIQAVRRGPEGIMKRPARREAGRLTSRVLWCWFR
jgi:hypothetical protein